jgi:hypothetical protein
MSSKIMKNIIPKIFDQGGSHTRMLSVFYYEKGRLNIVVMEPKQKKKVKKVSIDLNALHPLDTMDMRRQIGEILNRYVMIPNLGIKKMQVINKNLRNHLKNEKLTNRSKQIRVEELERWVMDLGSNLEDVASMQALVKTKETELQALKRRLKIHGIEHVQTPELCAIKEEKDELMKKMVQIEEEMELQQNKIEILKGGFTSSCAITSIDAKDGLLIAPTNLDIKGDEIEKLKRIVATRDEEMKGKDKFIT